jgi:hypothetical protein
VPAWVSKTLTVFLGRLERRGFVDGLRSRFAGMGLAAFVGNEERRPAALAAACTRPHHPANDRHLPAPDLRIGFTDQ